MLKTIEYFKKRIGEKGTWLSIGAGVTGTAALSVPWSYVFIAVAVAGALCPTP